MTEKEMLQQLLTQQQQMSDKITAMERKIDILPDQVAMTLDQFIAQLTSLLNQKKAGSKLTDTLVSLTNAIQENTITSQQTLSQTEAMIETIQTWNDSQMP